MNKILAIIGSGQLGQQIAHYAISDCHFNNIVFFDDFAKDSHVKDFKVLGTTEDIVYNYNEGNFTELIIGIGYNHIKSRKDFFLRFFGTIPFATIIHSSCWIDKTVKIMSGCIIYPGCVIEPNVIIDYNCILNISCSVSHDSKVGAHSFLSPKVAISGFVNANECCIFGTNTTIIDNIYIADNVRFGAGTVVIKNIENKGLYVGNPQKFIR